MRSVNKLAIGIILIVMSTTAVSQVNEALRYFPHAVGNTWRGKDVIDGKIYDSRISKTLTAANGSTEVFFDSASGPRYRIDTTGNVYQYVGSSTILWFMLSGQQGDSFYTWSNTYKVKITIDNETIFGVTVPTKTFTWFSNPPGTLLYAKQTLAKDFGIIRSFAQFGPTDSYVTGCIIDGIRFGTLLSVYDNRTNLPKSYFLHQNYPNPFNPTTTIKFSLPSSEHVKLTIYNLLGQEEKVLVDEVINAGDYSIQFNAVNFISGTYFYQLITGQYIQTRKMVLVK